MRTLIALCVPVLLAVAPKVAMADTMPQAAFCRGLEVGVGGFAKSRGQSPVRATLLASRASAALVDEWRAGVGAEFLDAGLLLGGASSAGERGERREFLALAPLVSEALGMAPGVRTTVAFSVDELRYMPNAQPGTHIVLITGSEGDLTPERAKRVVAAARGLGVVISLIWTGGSSAMTATHMTDVSDVAGAGAPWPAAVAATATGDGALMAALAEATGGRVVRLDGSQGCAEAL